MEEALIAKYSPFLAEARKRLLFTFIVFAVASITGFTFYETIIKLLIDLLSLKGINLVFTSPFQFINLSIACGLTTGVVVILPLFMAQLLSFLKPALKRKEFSMVTRSLPLSILLFCIGFIFGAFIMKWQIEIFLDKSISLGIGNVLDISRLLTTVLLTSVLMGIGFQFPVVLFLLMKINLISRQQLKNKRLSVYLGSFIFAILLPADSILADVLLSLPLIILFELTLFVSWLSNRGKANQ
ncbi:hypothetical protein A3A64_01750 [Candidatus Gottesmanbacteria bacterium RIFCSPLOWO2_01_FULL_48_11]|uniref:TatABCE protein translocation system subunit n=2 Tax=Candidatus Gottesmaniibacteriota TaxID=1752720 RepID=A0A0G1UNN5_9BACT|nr:MAG: TatABCE protein translocation system subunit [Candidatus Gottesmanbacteria bacterium GW2011_GWA1_48_13]OGG27509.1 MAG: hypothetical protein A3A64_01750 [Candidatus Gottesmanbacteria bacterium RIFCSPLOWO2_01_FULL_48_11]